MLPYLKMAAILCLTGGLVLLASCTPPITIIRPSGNVVTQEPDLAGFDALEVSHSFRVDVTQGELFHVLLRVDENVLNHLDVRRQGDTLRIGLEPGVGYSTSDLLLEAEVTMPEVTGLVLSGASRTTLDGFRSSRRLEVNVSGASYLTGEIECEDAELEVSGASHVTLDGSAGDIRINASGASSVDLEAFPVDNARVQASGASNVTIDASGTLDAEASGASHIFYVGSPDLGDVDTSGASSVRPK